MKYIGIALREVVGLFVSDWSQAVGIVLILVVAFGVTRSLRSPYSGFGIAALLGAHLALTSLRASNRQRPLSR